MTDGNRLVVIRDAEKISNWAPLTGWLAYGRRQLPRNHLLLISNDADLPREPGGRRAAAATFIDAMKPPKGYVVKCSALNHDDAVAWVRERSTLDARTAEHLLTRTGGNLSAAADLCAKLALFGEVTVSTAVVDQLVGAQPATDFTDSLLAGDKPAAFSLIPEVADRDCARVTGLLDSRLDLLAKLWQSHSHGHYGQAVPGVSPFLVRQYTAIAKHYPPERCGYDRTVLAVVEHAFREGAREGIWETLVALW